MYPQMAHNRKMQLLFRRFAVSEFCTTNTGRNNHCQKKYELHCTYYKCCQKCHLNPPPLSPDLGDLIFSYITSDVLAVPHVNPRLPYTREIVCTQPVFPVRMQAMHSFIYISTPKDRMQEKDVIVFYSCLIRKLKEIFRSPGIRYSSWIGAPQLSSPPTPH